MPLTGGYMNRRLTIETLETRYAFCGPENLDLNGDNYVTPQDALVAVNAVNQGKPVPDVNCDGVGTARDVLRIVNYINSHGNTTAQDVRLLYWGGGGVIWDKPRQNIWSINVEGTGPVEFDIALEIRDWPVRERFTPHDLLSLVTGSEFTIEPFDDLNHGTIYRVRGEIRGSATLQFLLDGSGLAGKDIAASVLWQKWSHRFGQQISSEIVLPVVSVFESSQ